MVHLVGFYYTNISRCTVLRISNLLSYLLTCLLTYLFTPRSTVLLEKLTGFQLVKKFPAFYGTPSFITAFTSARHLSLSWAWSIQSMPPHPTYLRSILILHQMLLRWRYRGQDGRALWHTWEETEMHVGLGGDAWKERGHLKHLGVYGRKPVNKMARTGFIWTDIRANGGHLWTRFHIMFRLDD
jgi:hypothetical protein